MNAPAGTPSTIPAEIPLEMSATARPPDASGTSRRPIAPAKDQTAPTEIPRITRPTSITAKFGAAATTIADTGIKLERNKITKRRSVLPATKTPSGAARAEANPVIDTIKPATPSETPRSRAMGVINPIGSNSVVTKAKVTSVIDATANQARISAERRSEDMDISDGAGGASHDSGFS
jgi:hypothetical protein